MTPKRGFTIGYEGAHVDQVAAAAKAAGVTLVIDTRRHPTSRRPDYRREALRRQFAERGIGYVSSPMLGVPKRVRPLAKRRPALFRAAYRGVLGRAPEAVEATIDLAARETVALLCFEAEPRGVSSRPPRRRDRVDRADPLRAPASGADRGHQTIIQLPHRWWVPRTRCRSRAGSSTSHFWRNSPPSPRLRTVGKSSGTTVRLPSRRFPSDGPGQRSSRQWNE